MYSVTLPAMRGHPTDAPFRWGLRRAAGRPSLTRSRLSAAPFPLRVQSLPLRRGPLQAGRAGRPGCHSGRAWGCALWGAQGSVLASEHVRAALAFP